MTSIPGDSPRNTLPSPHGVRRIKKEAAEVTLNQTRPSTVPTDSLKLMRDIPSFLLRNNDYTMQEEDQSYDGRPWTAGLQSQLNGMHDWDNNRYVVV